MKTRGDLGFQAGDQPPAASPASSAQRDAARSSRTQIRALLAELGPDGLSLPSAWTSAVQWRRAWGSKNPRRGNAARKSAQPASTCVCCLRCEHHGLTGPHPSGYLTVGFPPRLGRCTSLHLTLRTGRWIHRSFSGSSSPRQDQSQPSDGRALKSPDPEPRLKHRGPARCTFSRRLWSSRRFLPLPPIPSAPSPSALCTRGLRALTPRARLASAAATPTSRVLAELREVAVGCS